jgi:chemotaxis protein methyltransferase CheR
MKELPKSWRDRVFAREDDAYCLKPEYRRNIEFLEQDIRRELPVGPFDLILCRNLVFTYFDDAQLKVLSRLVGAMHDDAGLVIGVHEKLPEGAEGLSMWFDTQRIYRKSSSTIDGMNE